jgi:hypothetical protein
VSANDVWAVGQRNDTGGPDHELILHWDGARWSVLPSANHGTASAALYGVRASDNGVWAGGETTDATAGGHPLVERVGEDMRPAVVTLPSTGTTWSPLWGIAASDDAVWPVGTFVNLSTDNNQALVLQGADDPFRIVKAPNLSTDTNIFGGAATASRTVWAVGHFRDGGSRLPLIERHNEE